MLGDGIFQEILQNPKLWIIAFIVFCICLTLIILRGTVKDLIGRLIKLRFKDIEFRFTKPSQKVHSISRGTKPPFRKQTKILVFISILIIIIFIGILTIYPQPEKHIIMTNSIEGMKLVYIPAGSFYMGRKHKPEDLIKKYKLAPADKEIFNDELSQDGEKHPIHKGFWMGQTEVTKKQYMEVMDNDQPWSGLDGVNSHNDSPAQYISWAKAEKFCEKLSEKEKKKYRLPTEAEWEYACRAGSNYLYSFGDDPSLLNKYAWSNQKKLGKPILVKQRLPNKWRLYDMHGNVSEWCIGLYKDDYNPNNRDVGTYGHEFPTIRYHRGGAFDYIDYKLRCSARFILEGNDDDPKDADRGIGFRVVCFEK